MSRFYMQFEDRPRRERRPWSLVRAVMWMALLAATAYWAAVVMS